MLILDTARFKYPPHWVPLEMLFKCARGVGCREPLASADRQAASPAAPRNSSPSPGPAHRQGRAVLIAVLLPPAPCSAMAHVDPATGRPRGFMRMGRSPRLDSVLFTLDVRDEHWRQANRCGQGPGTSGLRACATGSSK